MSNKTLTQDEAVDKLKTMAEGIDFAMLATNLDSRPLHMVPMSTKTVGADGSIWFLSGRDSEHNRHIQNSSQVHLIYSDASAMRFLNVFGTASIHDDEVTLQKLYQDSDDAWFDGIHDSNLTAIQVNPTDAFYWDPRDGKLVTLLKLGVAALTGNQPDVIDQGKLELD